MLVVGCLLFVCRGLAVFDARGLSRVVHCSVSISVCGLVPVVCYG